jgi:hypothetical protein
MAPSFPLLPVDNEVDKPTVKIERKPSYNVGTSSSSSREERSSSAIDDDEDDDRPAGLFVRRSRLKDEAASQRENRQSAVLKEIAERKDEIYGFWKRGELSEALARCLQLESYISFLRDAHEPQLQRELEEVARNIKTLKSKGADRDPTRRVTFRLWALVLMLLTGLLVFVAYKANLWYEHEKAQGQQVPGAVHGRFVLAANGGLDPIKSQVVYLAPDNETYEGLVNLVQSQKSAKEAWQYLQNHAEKAAATGQVRTLQTDNLGRFAFDNVLPGDYILITTSKSAARPVLWMWPVTVKPDKTEVLELRDEQSLKIHGESGQK